MCDRVAEASLALRKETARFKKPPYLHPTEKGAQPLSIWCLDCAVNLTPAAPCGGTSVIVAIDPFSKFVEMGILPAHNSQEVARWVHEQIVCRYGQPIRFCTDKGTEFMGAFD